MRFLLISDSYPPIFNPSGQIVYLLAQELMKQGHFVDVIARDESFHITESGNGKICWMESTKWAKLHKKAHSEGASPRDKALYKIVALLRKLWMIPKIIYFPNNEIELTRKIVTFYNTELYHNCYDAVVGFFYPFSCLDAAMEISKNTPGAKCVCCRLDTVEESHRPSFMPAPLYRKLIQKADRRVLEQSDYVMYPHSAKTLNDSQYSQYSSKIVYFDFPTFVQESSSDYGIAPSHQQGNTLRLVYAGALDVNYRNPKRMLEILNLVAAAMPETTIQLDIFGGGNCYDIIHTFQTKDNFIVCSHGRVPKSEVTAYEAEADILVNIMNTFSSMVPSKIFGLFATGKPLLNVMTKGDDSSMKYITKYPAVYTMLPESDRNQVAEEVAAFFREFSHYRANIDEIRKLYYTCTPDYFAQQIIQMCE